MTESQLSQLKDLIEAAHFAPDDDAYLAIVIDNLVAPREAQQKQIDLLTALVEGQTQLHRAASNHPLPPGKSSMSKKLTARDLDAYCRSKAGVPLSAKTAANKRHDGTGPAYYRDASGRAIYDSDDVDEWLAVRVNPQKFRSTTEEESTIERITRR